MNPHPTIARPAWPRGDAYREALATPGAIADPELSRASVEQAADGLPKAYAGSFATAFHLRTPRGDVALRCFTRPDDQLERRYTAIAELLRYVHNDALCQTRFLPDGVLVDGTWWPVVAMDWVAGRPLNVDVEARLGNGDALLALANAFREAVRFLGVLGIAHGDLQHGNILVHRGTLRLIDYDAMFLPAIAGLPQVEFGHRNYQHPQRPKARFDNRLDRFSAIVIYTALVALSADPQLWARFNDGSDLLFRAHDFVAPGRTELWRALQQNAAAANLAQMLMSACEMPTDQVPTLEYVIRAAAGTTVAPLPRPSPPLRLPLVSQAAPAPAGPQSRAQDLATAAIGRVRDAQRLAAMPLLGLLMCAVIGLAIGFLIAGRHGTPSPLAQSAPVVVTVSPIPTATPAPAVPSPRAGAPVLRTADLATPAPAAVRTAPPAVPTAPPTPIRTAAPATPAPAAAVGVAAIAGPWQIREANVQVGEMVWTGSAGTSPDGRVVLDTHKSSVAGRPATPCERQTTLHAAFALRAGAQSVPYREVNCQGTASAGELRITGFAPDKRSFSGSFWEGGTKLGDFTASRE